MIRKLSLRKWLRLDQMWDRFFAFFDSYRGGLFLGRRLATSSLAAKRPLRPFFDLLEDRLTPAGGTIHPCMYLTVPNSPNLVYGQTAPITATIGAPSGTTITPTGTAKFYEIVGGSDVLLGTGSLSFVSSYFATASITPSGFSVGAHSLRVDYLGDGTFTTGSASATETVDKADTTISLSASSTSPAVNSPVSFSIRVSALSPGAGIPTGTVDLDVGGGTIYLGLPITNGVVQQTLASGVAAGVTTINVKYNGDSNFNTSGPVYTTITVQNPVTPQGEVGTACDCGCLNQEGTLTKADLASTGNVVVSKSANPIRYADGVAQIAQTDLSSDAFGTPWGQTRSWTNGLGYANSDTNGIGWVTTQMPSLLQIGTSIAEISNGMTAQYFDYSGGTYAARNIDRSTLVANTGTHEFTMTDAAGNKVTFNDFTVTNGKGQFKSFSAPDGSGIAVSATSGGLITELYREDATHTLREKWVYTYITGNVPNAGKLSNVTLKSSSNSGTSYSIVRQVDYTYYDGTQNHGNLGDLWTATIKDGSGGVIDTSYYRYYVSGETAGYRHGLEYVFAMDSFGRLTTALGTSLATLDAASNSSVSPYATNYFEYDTTTLRVTKEIAQGAGCSACSGGLGVFAYAYTASSNTTDYNKWASKTTETLPDNNQNVIYVNGYGETMLSVFIDKSVTPNVQWMTYYRYDTSGRTILKAEPSAVDSTQSLATYEAYPDLLHNVSGDYAYLKNSSGLITNFSYYTSSSTPVATSTTAGAVPGYQKDVSIQKGESGTASAALQESWTYFAVTAGGATVYPIANDTVYPVDNSTQKTTQHAYTYFSGTTQVQSVTVTHPMVATGQNGPGTADIETVFFDSKDRPIWTKDGRGVLGYIAYDSLTGAVVKQIVDVDTTQSGFANLPSGWATISGYGLHLITQFEVDAFGRTTKETLPSGKITYTVYIDTNHETRVYAGWNTTTNAPTLPTIVTRNNRALSYTESLTMTATPNLTSGRPNGTESIGSVQSLSRTYTNAAGQATTTDDYFLVSGLTYSTAAGLGAINVNYYETTQVYDVRGRPSKTVSPTGTINRTVYDGLDRVVSEWIGIVVPGASLDDDEPTSGYWSATNSANMVKTREYIYDNAGIGDGNLTRMTEKPGLSAADRVSDFFYDWRDRLVATKQGVEASEGSTLDRNRPITYVVLDNWGDAIATKLFDGDTVSITDANSDGVPDEPSSSLLRKQSTVDFDDRGRLYRTTTFDVNQSTGAVSSTGQATNLWYDRSGNVFASQTPDGMATKTVFDGAGRPVTTYTTTVLPGVSSITVNGNIPVLMGPQRSRVASVVIVFNQPVHLDAGAVGVSLTPNVVYNGTTYSSGFGTIPTTLILSTEDSVTWILTFSGNTDDGADGYKSLRDGVYNFDIDPSKVHAFGNSAITMAGHWTADRLFGDIDGPTTPSGGTAGTDFVSIVNTADNFQFSSSFNTPANYVAAFDFNGDGYIDTTDNIQFRARFNKPLSWSVTATGVNVAGPTWATANVLTADTVVEQTENQFDADSNVIFSTTRQRTPAATGAGPLGTATTGVLARVSYMAQYFDLANRPTDSVDVGTNSGTAWTRPSTVPSRSDSVHVVSQSYDAAGWLLDATDPMAVVSRTLHDALGRTTSTIGNYTGTAATTPTQSHDQTVNYAYDGSNHLVSQTLVIPGGTSRQTAYVYGVTTAGGSAIRSNDILSAIREPDPTTGVASSSRQTTLKVNALGEVVSTTDALSGVTTVTRDTVGRQSTIQNARTDVTAITSYGYDAAGNVVKITDAESHQFTFGFDGYGHRVTSTNYFGTSTAVFDPATGLQVGQIDANSKLTRFVHDAMNRLVLTIDPTGGKSTTYYDATGQVGSTVDPLGNTTTYSFDIFARASGVQDANSQWTTWTMDRVGRRLSLTDPNSNTTNFQYDNLGRMTQETDVSIGSGTRTITYTYNTANQLVQSVDRLNRDREFVYDNAGRLTDEYWKTTVGGTQVEHLTHGYDVLNRETSASNSAGSYALTYNKVGDVTYVSEPNSVSLTMTYDKVNNRTQVADSLGGTENSEYDQANRLKNRELIMTGSTPDPYETFTYDPANQVTGQSRYASKTGTLISTTTNTFDDAGRTKTMLSKDGSNATTQSFSYNYDAKGRVTSQTINGTTTTYSYDVTDQLTADGSTAYTYDNDGNRTMSGYSTGSDNRLLSDGTWNYTYDAEGNETQKAKIVGSEKWLYAYDHRNQMTKAEHISTGTTIDLRVTYKYDIWGNRVEKTVDPDGDTGSTTVVTNKFAVDGWNPAKNGAIGTSNFDVWADLNGSGSLVTRYMRGDKIDEILARVDLSGAHTGAFWYLNDQLGSIRAVVDNTGVVKDAITYNAFGGITAETDSSYRGRYVWTGREVEVETALQYNRARYYDPAVGRWTSRDPMGFDAGDSNLYRYVRNAPTNYNDPSGMEWRNGVWVGAGRPPANSMGIAPQGISDAEFERRLRLRLFLVESGLFFGELAAAAYVKGSTPEQLKRIQNKGITLSDPTNDPETGLQARLYILPNKKVILAFAGTDELIDWAVDGWNALTPIVTAQYTQAVKLAQGYQKIYGENLMFLGHSLGGGLSQTCSLVTGLPSITFNSAGPSESTVTRLGGKWDPQQLNRLSVSYRTNWEALSSLQYMFGGIVPRNQGQLVKVQSSVNGLLVASGRRHMMGNVLDGLREELFELLLCISRVDRRDYVGARRMAPSTVSQSP